MCKIYIYLWWEFISLKEYLGADATPMLHKSKCSVVQRDNLHFVKLVGVCRCILYKRQ
jgi:hypothetical protein